MFRYLSRLLIVSIVMFGVSSRAMAQAGTPADEPRGASRSLLQELGLPEIDVVVTDASASGAPSELAAGRYLVTLENLTSEQEIGLLFLAAPDDISDQDALDGILGEDLPSWFWDATFAGGPTAFSGQTDMVVVELAAGDWWVDVDRTSSSDAGQPTDSATRLQVSGELPATAALADAIPILLSEYHFDLPASLVAGPQIWQLTNTGAQPHFLGLVELPEGTTTGQLTEFLDMALTGTPAVSALGFDDVQDVYSSVIFSAGQTTWIEVDLTPGTYGVACLVSDRYSQAPHAMLGMIQVFTVQ